MRYAAHPMLTISCENSKRYSFCHVIRIPIERCEKQLMFHDDKYHRIGSVTPSLLEQVLKFYNSSFSETLTSSPILLET